MKAFLKRVFVPPETPDIEVYQDTLIGFVWVMSIVGGIAWMRLIALDTYVRGVPLLSTLVVGGLLIGGSQLAYRNRRNSFGLSWVLVVVTLIVAIGVEAWGSPHTPARYYYPVAILVSSLSMSGSGVFGGAALAILVHLFVSHVLGIAWNDADFMTGPLLLILMTSIASWFASRYLRTALESAETYYARTRDGLIEIREQRAELTRTVKALGDANTRLEKMATELIRARNAAQEADRLKSEFLAHMSHELRTPLNAILNFTAFVTDGLMGEVNEAQVDTLQKVTDSANHLLSLINDVLDISKIEAGLMTLFIEEVNVNDALRSSISITKGLLKNKPIELIADVEENLPRLNADKRRIRQIFLNLVSNAVKFTPQGSITITARYQADKNEIYVAVQDTGIGIAPEDQEMVFEPFKQAKTDLQNVVGTGLGLPLCRHFIQAHGGRIWLTSQLGVGSTFHVVLPVDNQHALQAAMAQSQTPLAVR